uniref:Putative secreted protein n=1 Tax=Anopheles triannulatus TaxID=58253 RepID=A0A2M4B1K7_9DIPT
MRRLASASLNPSCCSAITHSCAIPSAASPAPWNSIRFSDSLVRVIRSEANRPATATAAVPWMSSLNVQ